jgi:carbon starvation protein
LNIYGSGIARFLSVLGFPEKIGFSFGLLALSAFILTTLDTATRLGRYIFEELFSLKSGNSRIIATFATLLLPTIFVLINLKDSTGAVIPAWKAIWPVFGASNQLLAGLVALVIAVWLHKTRRKFGFVVLPVLFLNTVTIWALVLLLKQYKFSTIGVIAGILLILAFVLIVETLKTFRKMYQLQKSWAAEEV